MLKWDSRRIPNTYLEVRYCCCFSMTRLPCVVLPGCWYKYLLSDIQRVWNAWLGWQTTPQRGRWPVCWVSANKWEMYKFSELSELGDQDQGQDQDIYCPTPPSGSQLDRFCHLEQWCTFDSTQTQTRDGPLLFSKEPVTFLACRQGYLSVLHGTISLTWLSNHGELW